MAAASLAFELLIHNFSWLHPFATGAPDRARGHAGHGAARRNVFQHHRASRNPRIFADFDVPKHLGAGAKVLGHIEVGEDARIAAGSVVLENVAPRCTVAGVPARPIGGPCCEGVKPAEIMNQQLEGE